jgi:glutamine---fructose-6-phosphate transaminase (isomerizing)
MCGIFGIVDFRKNRNKERILRDMVNESCRRGTDAAGVGIFGFGKGIIIKKEGSGKKLLESDEFIKTIVPLVYESKVIIGQTRLATNGSPKLFINNQPFGDNKFCLVHNGIIVNAGELAKKYKIFKKQSDSKILYEIIKKESQRLGSTREAIVKISGEMAGTMNIVIVSKDKNKIMINTATNNGSLYIGVGEKMMILASEEIFLKRVAVKNNLDIKIIKIKAKTGMEIDERGNKINYLLNESKVSKERTILTKPTIDLMRHSLNKNIEKIKRCNKCLLPLNTPNIKFDNQGVCNLCQEHKKINYGSELELKKIVLKYKKINKPDCIIAFSGGRDSAYGLHYLVKKLGMHPVAVTFDWGMLSDIGRRNQARLLGKLGIEHIIVSADLVKVRKDIKNNLEAWLKKPDLGMVPILMQADKVTEYYVDKIKKELGLELVFFCRGNELEREEFKAGYCGVKNADPGGVIHNYALVDKWRLLWYYIRQFIRNPSYLNSSLISSMFGYLVTYVVPHNYVYLWHYIKWEEKKIIKTLFDEYGWEDDGENGITWRIDDGSPAFYNYLYGQIQGFTENDSFRSNQIREGIMTREEAIKIVERENMPRYAALQWYFDTIGIDGDRVLSIIDKVEKRYKSDKIKP